MNVIITCRHLDISSAIKDYVTRKLSSVLESHREVESAHAILDIQRFNHIVEVVVQAKRHIKIEASESSDDMYKSVDKAVDKLDRQLKRSREKVVDHKPAKKRVKLSDFERDLSDNTGD